MRKLTFKDFIYYNNSNCFSCGNKVKTYLVCIDKKILNNNTTHINDYNKRFYIKKKLLNPSADSTLIELSNTYFKKLKIEIIHNTNKFVCSLKELFFNFIINNNTYLLTECSNCSTYIESDYLKFSIEKEFLLPISILNENVFLYTESYVYNIFSDFINKKSTIIIRKISKEKSAPFDMIVPLLPLSKFKSKQEFINKLNIYLTFS